MARKTQKPATMGTPGGRAPRSGGGPSLVRGAREAALSPGKDRRPPGEEIVQRKHEDWTRWEILWRHLLDSHEGGQRYRDAEYGTDREGRPLRNLIRHKRETVDPLRYPTAQQGLGNNAGSAVGVGNPYMLGPFPGMLGADPAATAHDDDYEYRRARTTPPDFVKEVVDIHTGKIFDQDISRAGPPELVRWWDDCVGAGISIRDWMREDVAPLLLVLGCLDVCFDRKVLPHWVEIKTRADEIEHGLDTCVAAVILPVNMVWWVNDPAGHYQECLVREYWSPTLQNPDDADQGPLRDNAQGWAAEFPGESRPRDIRYRHWTRETVTLYDGDGEIIEPTKPHGYPCVPIVRLIDRKRHRTPMIGAPRYEDIAECQRDYYNRDSELILSDTLQAMPILSGPEEFVRADQTISVGPGYVLPMKQCQDGSHQGWVYVSPPKEPANSIRESLRQIREKVDRSACLMKPAGVKGTTGGTVSQSGYSKAMDAESGNKKLSGIAQSLARAERQMAEFSLMCILRRALTVAERRAIKITYPARFQLKQGQEILNELTALTNILAIETQITVGLPLGQSGPGSGPPDDQQGGNPARPPSGPGLVTPTTKFLCPTLFAEMISDYARVTFPGRGEEVYRQVRRESMAFHHLHVLPEYGTVSDAEAMQGHGSEEQMAGEDRTGQSAATAINPTINQAT